MNPLRPLAPFILLAPLAAQAVVLQPAPGAKATETRTLAIAAGAPIRVKNVNGRIRLTGTDRADVSFTGAFTPGPKGEQVKVVLEPKDGGLEIRGEYPKNTPHGMGCDMEVLVPRSVMARLESVNGEVRLKDVSGKAECSTVNGAVDIENVGGPVEASTVNGSITGKGVGSRINAHSVNGTLTFSTRGLQGRVTASSVNGGFHIRSEGAKDVQASRHRFEATFPGDGQLTLKTVNGDIRVD
jgi:DUF4097 and DUF4098 domain-containing protein YvlB